MTPPRWVTIAGGLALLGVTYAVAATVPSTAAMEAPFGTQGVIGETLSGRVLEATVTEVRFADELRADDWHGTTNGVWLVADAIVAGVIEPSTVTAVLIVDGVEYAATDRISFDALSERVVDPLLPIIGSIAFEVPADLPQAPGAGAATLVLQPGRDARLESVLEVRVDLTSLEHVDRIQLETPREVAR